MTARGPFHLCGSCPNPDCNGLCARRAAVQARRRKPDPTMAQRFAASADAYLTAHPLQGMALSFGALTGFAVFVLQAVALLTGGA